MLVIAPFFVQGQGPDTLKAYEASQKAEKFYDVSNFDSAKFWFNRSADLWEKSAEETMDSLRWARAFVHRNKASICNYVIGRLEEAEQSLELTLANVLEIWSSNPALEAQYFDYQGLIFIKKRLMDSAYHYVDKALALKRQVYKEQSLPLAESYSTLGGLTAYKGNYEKALELNLKVLDIRSALLPPVDTQLAKAYNNLGYIYFNLGATDIALENYLKAIEIRRRNGTDQGYGFAIVLGNLGVMYRELGDYQQSLAYHYKELDIKNTTLPGNHRSLARNYFNLAKANFEIGNYDLALEYGSESLKIFKMTLDDHDDIVNSLRNEVGRALVKKGRFEEALTYFNENLAPYSAGSYINLALTHNNIAEGYLSLKNYDKALYHYEEALQTSLDGNNQRKHPTIADYYLKIGRLYQQMDRPVQSLENLQKALIYNLKGFNDYDPFHHPDVKDTVFDRMSYLEILSEKGQVLTQMGSSDDNYLLAADTTWQLAIQLIGNLRTGYHNESSKLGLLEKSRAAFENHLHTLHALYRQTGNQRYLQRSFNTVEQTKSTILHEGIKTVKARTFGGVPQQVTRLEQTLRVKLAYNEKRIFDWENSPDPVDPGEILDAKARYFDDKFSYDSLVQLLEDKYPEYHKLKYTREVSSIGEVQNQLTDNTAVIEYMLADTLLYIFKITAADLDMERVELSPTFQDDLFAFIQGLKDQGSAITWSDDAYLQYLERATSIYQVLLGQVLDGQRAIKKLIIVPDGILNYLPFECLVTSDTQSAGKEIPYLIRNINTRYAYSASLMVEDNLARKAPSEDFIGFGPQYGDGVFFASARGLDLLDSTTRAGIAPLKFNQQEVEYIAGLLSGRAITGGEVSENTFRELAPQARILHLAMHALVHDENPRYSGFLFPGAMQEPMGEDSIRYESDNFLHAFELYNMQLNSELAVLSACETGFGKLQQGEGIMSLSRAFRYSGSPNLVMSLWQADDQATYDLMKEFYKGIDQGLPKDEALRQAKITYLDTHDRTHPYFWANFVLIGDDKPVGLSSGTPAYAWYIVIGFVSLFLLFLFLRRKQEAKA